MAEGKSEKVKDYYRRIGGRMVAVRGHARGGSAGPGELPRGGMIGAPKSVSEALQARIKGLNNTELSKAILLITRSLGGLDRNQRGHAMVFLKALTQERQGRHSR